MDDITKIDIYELLNISITADDKEIKSAYRKKALVCHPDKNPDNPKAAELFQQLSKALEILTDSKAKAAYDQVLRAKKATVVRNRELDSKRRKLKEDLEAREKAAQDIKITEIDAAKNLQKEIERLRKEGSKQVEQEKELLRQQIIDERDKYSYSYQQPEPDDSHKLKIKWRHQKGERIKYTENDLRSILEKYGQIAYLVVSKRKSGSAVVEFSTEQAARSALEAECGNPDNPLKMSLVSDRMPKEEHSVTYNENAIPVKRSPPAPDSSSTLTSRDYESVVLMKLRQAEERKKLIQQMMAEDN